MLFVNMFLLLSITYLLPLDVFYAAQSFDRTPIPSNETLIVQRDTRLTAIVSFSPNFEILWSLLYWSQFAICWFVFPVLISYIDLKYLYPRSESDSGNQILKRIQTAIFMNLKFYVFCVLALIVGLLYLTFATNHGMNEVKPLIISMSHLYSLSYTLILLSNGLIRLPKSLLFEEQNEKRLFVKLSQNNEDLNESKLSLIESAEKVLSIKHSSDLDSSLDQSLQECQLEVQRYCNELELTIPILNSSGRQNNTTSLSKLNECYNAFKTEYYNYSYHQTKSDEIIHTLVISQRKTISVPINIFKRSAGVVSMLLSMTVFMLELTPVKFGHRWVFMGKTVWNFLLEMAILLYNTICSLFSMSHIKIQNFHLVRNGKSSPKNALYFSLYSSRLLFPLCFNYMILIPKSTDTDHQSSFEKVLYHQLEMIPLAKFLNEYLPVLFVVIVPLAQYFELREKLLSKVLGEEYYYQLFGSIPTNESQTTSVANSRSRLDEDYEYSLQDGQYIFERATSNYSLNGNNGG